MSQVTQFDVVGQPGVYSTMRIFDKWTFSKIRGIIIEGSELHTPYTYHFKDPVTGQSINKDSPNTLMNWSVVQHAVHESESVILWKCTITILEPFDLDYSEEGGSPRNSQRFTVTLEAQTQGGTTSEHLSSWLTGCLDDCPFGSVGLLDVVTKECGTRYDVLSADEESVEGLDPKTDL